jgi:ribosome biogenesis GTPase
MKDDIYHIEEDFHDRDNKEEKRNRKALEKKDRSKFKKTDTAQKKSQIDDKAVAHHFIKGRVISVESEGVIVFDEETKSALLCSVKGSLKQETKKEKNLITIGDFVRYEKNDTGSPLIYEVYPRHSTLYRAENYHRRKVQLIAANIDQVFITVSCLEPALKPGLIDRYIIAALRGNMTPIILINKMDLLEHLPSEKALILEIINVYRDLGFTVIPMSIKDGSHITELEKAMQNKTSVFSGQSGVGKTSLINLVTGHTYKTTAVSSKTSKGAHTTTKAHLVPLSQGGFCIDTPGIRSFGMWDLKKDEIQHYFIEIDEKRKKCKYFNCTHQSEPDCAVKKAVEKGKISPLRYQSYLSLMEEDVPDDY